MADAKLIIDHTERALAHLTSDFDNSPNVRGVATALVSQVQELETLYFDMIVAQMLSSAVGAQLDKYGRLLGEPRDGLLDREYRRFLSAAIAAHRSEGTIPDLYTAIMLITGAQYATYRPSYPAAFILQYAVPSYLPPKLRQRVYLFMHNVTALGIGITLVEHKPNAFGFADDPNALGFGEGEWAEIIGADT